MSEKNRAAQKCVERGWEMIERGWWCKQGVGGVVREAKAKWSANRWNEALPTKPPIFPTMVEAMDFLESEHAAEAHL